ncbi:MAG: hypothetical protein AABY68_01355 [Pseudomonadota bacterium]
MDTKYANTAVNRREALRKIGQCAEYTGAVVAFLSVSTPSWASAGSGTKPGCGGIDVNIDSQPVRAHGCIEVEFDRRGASVSSNASGKTTGIGQVNSNAVGSSQTTGGINNSYSTRVDNSVEADPVGPSYQ